MPQLINPMWKYAFGAFCSCAYCCVSLQQSAQGVLHHNEESRKASADVAVKSTPPEPKLL